MPRLTLLVVVVVVGFSAAKRCPAQTPSNQALEKFEFSERHMGVLFNIVFYADDLHAANRASTAAFARIKQLNTMLSDYLPDSELNRLSKSSPTKLPITVSDDLWAVLSRSQQLARKTNGAFDVTVGPYTSLWRRSRRQKELPAPEQLEAARRAVGFAFLNLCEKRQTAELLQEGMRLDLGGIAKGYAADEALRVLQKHGINRALVDGSGDVAIGDPPPGKTGWRVGIAPLRPNEGPSRFFSVARRAVATSGDVWQYVEIDGVRYSHIIDPKTGLGLTTPSSVTVVARDCMTADSLASAVSVLGPERGIKLIDETCGTAAMIVLKKADGTTPSVFLSQRFRRLDVPRLKDDRH